MEILLILLISVVALARAVWRWGVESRDGIESPEWERPEHWAVVLSWKQYPSKLRSLKAEPERYIDRRKISLASYIQGGEPVRIEQFFLEGSDHLSYLVTDGTSGQAVVIDPRRDVDVYLQAAERAGVHITHILQTHVHHDDMTGARELAAHTGATIVHHDYLRGARELAAHTGATIMGSAQGHLLYDHQAVRDGDRLQVGQVRFHVIATPGHTPEHVSYVVSDLSSDIPCAVFSGGSLLVGGAGRTDLLGPEMTLPLMRQQYHSLFRLLETLPDSVHVYPAHAHGRNRTLIGSFK